MIHTPESSAARKTAIQAATGLTFEDTSYQHDLCDSMKANLPGGKSVKVYLSNCIEVSSKNEFITYSIRLLDKNQEDVTPASILDTVYTLSEVIEELKRMAGENL